MQPPKKAVATVGWQGGCLFCRCWSFVGVFLLMFLSLVSREIQKNPSKTQGKLAEEVGEADFLPRKGVG